MPSNTPIKRKLAEDSEGERSEDSWAMVRTSLRIGSNQIQLMPWKDESTAKMKKNRRPDLKKTPLSLEDNAHGTCFWGPHPLVLAF